MYPYTHYIPLFHASFMEAGIPVPYRPSGEQAELGSLQFFYQPNCRDSVVYPVMLSILLWYNLFCSSLFSPEPISLPFFQVWLYHLFRDDSISVFPLKDIDIFSKLKTLAIINRDIGEEVGGNKRTEILFQYFDKLSLYQVVNIEFFYLSQLIKCS